MFFGYLISHGEPRVQFIEFSGPERLAHHNIELKRRKTLDAGYKQDALDRYKREHEFIVATLNALELVEKHTVAALLEE